MPAAAVTPTARRRGRLGRSSGGAIRGWHPGHTTARRFTPAAAASRARRGLWPSWRPTPKRRASCGSDVSPRHSMRSAGLRRWHWSSRAMHTCTVWRSTRWIAPTVRSPSWERPTDAIRAIKKSCSPWRTRPRRPGLPRARTRARGRGPRRLIEWNQPQTTELLSTGKSERYDDERRFRPTLFCHRNRRGARVSCELSCSFSGFWAARFALSSFTTRVETLGMFERRRGRPGSGRARPGSVTPSRGAATASRARAAVRAAARAAGSSGGSRRSRQR